MVANHECIHEELIQDHSLQLTELETKSKYKEQSIMEIKEDLKQVNIKLDKLISETEKSDSTLEKRVEKLETRIDIYELFFKESKEDKNKRITHQIAIFAVVATCVGILVGAILKVI